MTTVVLAESFDRPLLYPLSLVLASALRSARRAWRIGRERRRVARFNRRSLLELHSMSDRQLADIGLSRCDLPWVERDSALALVADDAVAWGIAFPFRGSARAGYSFRY
jgi:uncharacterized protein YjiS (DUF1127 family)